MRRTLGTVLAAFLGLALSLTAAPPAQAARLGAAPPACARVSDSRPDLRRPYAPCGVVLVNKAHRVGRAYVPQLVDVRQVPGRQLLRPDAARALDGLIVAARRAGVRLGISSAYRSYALQASYTPGIRVAPAGASEHQTGLAVDLHQVRARGTLRGYAFGTSAGGRWVRANAWRYGFVLRYPEGSSRITGYAFEPWHFRYVGVSLASAMRRSGVRVLETYLGQR